jgi:TolB-like protein
MAQIFVSYARADRALVAPLVAALSAEGWSVWWDPAINTGEEFDQLISSELETAKAVIVAWTPTSVESRWVRGEAREAANRGILIPVRFGNARLPLDVRTLHTTDMDGWRGDPNSASFQELLRGLRSLLRGTADRNQTPAAGTGARGVLGFSLTKRNMKLLGGAAALVLAAALGIAAFAPGRFHAGFVSANAWFSRNPHATNSGPVGVRVGVLSFDVLSDSATTRHFAGGLTDEIISTLSANQLQTISREDSVALRSADHNETLDRLGVALLFDGTVEENGDDIHVRVHLDSAVTHSVVWSGDFTRTAKESRTLQTEVAAKCAGMIQMALFAKSSPSAAVDDQTLALTLRVVEDLRYNAPTPQGEGQVGVQAAQLAEQLVAKAPDFAWGHSIRANALGFAGVVEHLAGAELQQRRQQERAEAEQALALDPKDAMAYFALSGLASSRQEFESIVLKGLSVDPHPAIFVGGLYGREASVMALTGRLREALNFYRRAAALDPLSSWESVGLASALATVGQMPEALEVFDRSLVLWPNDPSVRQAYLTAMLFSGTPKQALAMLADPILRPAALTQTALAAMRAFLNAKTNPSGDAKAKAVQAIRVAVASDLSVTDFAVPALASLGDVDAALAIAGNPGNAALAQSAFFIPATARLRADPRFMQLAARAGSVAYWQSTGKWPDFCNDERLPYDCKVEAARVMAEK